MYTTDSDGWLPPTSYNAQHIGYIILYYLKVKCDKFDPTYVAYVGPANSKPSGSFFYCPSLYASASDSPVWSGGTPSAYYFSNYMETAAYLPSDTTICGAWSYWDSSNALVSNRKFDRIKDGSVIMGESDYSSVSGIYNQCSALVSLSTSANAILTPSSPAWMLHNVSANFTFKDGHVMAYKYVQGTTFDMHYIPVR